MSRLHAWWVLARPAGLWIPPLLPLLGYGWAHWDRAVVTYRPWALIPLLLAWVALQAGTLWLNAARDQDTGEVLLGRSVPPPPGTARAGLVALVASIGLACIAGLGPGLCAGGCAALAALYSHPRWAWKAHPILGPTVNAVGYGLLSPLAGYCIIGGSPGPRTAVTAVLLVCTTLGWTFVSQCFQEEEDRARGDRTLVAMRGAPFTVRTARILLALPALGLVVLCALGWYPELAILGVLPMLYVEYELFRWTRLLEGGRRVGEGRARRLVPAGALSLALMCGAAAGHYAWESAGTGPVAGLATRAGHPDDRTPRPHQTQRVRDIAHRLRTGAPYRPR